MGVEAVLSAQVHKGRWGKPVQVVIVGLATPLTVSTHFPTRQNLADMVVNR